MRPKGILKTATYHNCGPEEWILPQVVDTEPVKPKIRRVCLWNGCITILADKNRGHYCFVHKSRVFVKEEEDRYLKLQKNLRQQVERQSMEIWE